MNGGKVSFDECFPHSQLMLGYIVATAEFIALIPELLAIGKGIASPSYLFPIAWTGSSKDVFKGVICHDRKELHHIHAIFNPFHGISAHNGIRGKVRKGGSVIMDDTVHQLLEMLLLFGKFLLLWLGSLG